MEEKFKYYSDSLIAFIEYWQTIDVVVRKYHFSNIIAHLDGLLNSASRKSLLVSRYIEKETPCIEVFNDFENTMNEMEKYYQLFALIKLKDILFLNGIDCKELPMHIC